MEDPGRTRTLAELGLTATAGSVARVTGLSVDSRQVRQGHLFAALPGTRVHGAEFAVAAVDRGAAAILTDREGAQVVARALAGRDVALVVTEDPRQALAYAASLWFGLQPPTVVAVTGTNGKTSVAAFTRQIWEALGLAAVNIGTTGIEGSWTAPAIHTTPEPVTLHRILAEAAEAGVTHAAMEASSHGLEQRRLDGVRLSAAAFTNFSQDHLDYHETLEAYFAAKAALFARVLPEDATSVVNVDDPRGRDLLRLAEMRGQDVLMVGRSEDAALRLVGQRFETGGQVVRFTWGGVARQAHLGLVGGFQASNALVAVGLALATGSEPAGVFEALPRLTGVRGRMQKVAERLNGAAVYVDYAHTPDAVKTALAALRPHVMGRLVVVLGAGGDRDRGKRPLMGRAAAEGADLVLVTDDNPRTEDPASIRAAVMAGAGGAIEVGDRAEAILRGVDALAEGDALLIAGKGHETGQVVGTTVYPFDDAEQASVAVAALDGQIA
jgi:UDP-N-acetylmuramoyl-L-alanyl-D-glutamate--2,6-diaminopimelate ligase